jgi:regulator of protease activity HflC (stomatin/prohibitin superfamily)
VRRTIIWDYEIGLRYVNGRFERRLGPGRYWEPGPLLAHFFGSYWTVRMDMRLRSLSITGQELVTRDKVNVRMTVAVQYRIADPELAIQQAQSYQDTLYQDVQLPLRGIVAQLDVDVLLESRDEVDQQLFDQAKGSPAAYGVELVKVGIKDVILPGEVRALMQRIVEARKSAEATLITAREEVAAARARQNVASMLRDNPAMLELLRLETMKEIAKSPGNTFVVGNVPTLPPSDGRGV